MSYIAPVARAMAMSLSRANCKRMSVRCTAVIPLLSAFVLFFAAGCGNGLASVKGTVTLDGQPVNGGPEKYGTVSFYRQGGGGAPGVAIIDGSGNYEVKTGAQSGIVPGAYDVAISIKKITSGADQYALPKATLISPPKYGSIRSSGLRADVKQGRNAVNFDLVTNAK
jgi:hypothetical protein